MRSLAGCLVFAAAVLASPVTQAVQEEPLSSTIDATTSTTSSNVAAYTETIDRFSKSEPPPLWDPPSPPPPPLFEAPEEDIPNVPSWLISVHQAPVQLVRVEKLAPFTVAGIHPFENMYAPSASDEEARFEGEGSLRPARKTLAQCTAAVLRSWIWWIGVITSAVLVVYVAEKLLIGSVKAARRARSASRVARSRAASLVQGTRSRAVSLFGDAGLSLTGATKEKSGSPAGWVHGKPARSKSWDQSMV